jgi:Adaptin C-terminal domain
MCPYRVSGRIRSAQSFCVCGFVLVACGFKCVVMFIACVVVYVVAFVLCVLGVNDIVHPLILPVLQYIKMMMGQPSSHVLSAGSKITQEIKLNNTEHGKHSLKLRFKLAYKTPEGNAFEDVVVVDTFPDGF